MAKAKKTRKQLLKREDAFLNAASQGAEWARENKTALIAGALAIAVVIAAIWGGAEFIRLRNLDASARLEEALALKDDGVVVTEPGYPAFARVAVQGGARVTVAALDPDLPVYNVRSMNEHVESSVFGLMPLRMGVFLAGLQGAGVAVCVLDARRVQGGLQAVAGVVGEGDRLVFRVEG